MNVLQLLPIGGPHRSLLDWLREQLSEAFHIRCEVLKPPLRPDYAFHPERGQYHSSELLERMQEQVSCNTWRVLGVTPVDLYIPILTFVFGEAQLGGKCSVVSYARLRQEFYGLPPDMNLLARRLLIESVHELGHTLDLHHCHDYRCVMSSSHAVEWIDLKEHTFCTNCAAHARSLASK